MKKFSTFVNQISNAMLAFSQALKQCTVADIDGLTSLEEHLTLAAPTDASSKTHKHLTLTDLTARKTLLIAERESTASFPPTTAASGPLFAPAQAGAAPVKPYWPPENSSPAIKRLHDLLAPFTTFKTTRSEVACPFDLARFKEEEAASFLENYVQALNACSVSDFRAIEDLSSSIEASFNRSNKPEQLLALVHGTNARSLVLSYEYYNKPLPANMEHYKTDLMRAATEDTVHAYLFTSSATP